HLDRGVLEILPVDAGGVAHVQKESDHYRLIALAREELDLLVFAFVLDTEVSGVQVGYETPPIVGHGNRHDDFVDLYFDRRRLGQLNRALRVLSKGKTGKECGCYGTAQH